jgi:hypothetical protein
MVDFLSKAPHGPGEKVDLAVGGDIVDTGSALMPPTLDEVRLPVRAQ